MAVGIERVTPAVVDRAAAVLASAFADDALFLALFPDPLRRPRQVTASCRWTVRSHVAGGAIVETTRSRRGVGIWQPPGHRFPWWLGLRAASDTAAMLRAMGADARRSLGWFSREERQRQALLPRAHWFLVMLGVEPAYQQFGLGAALALYGLDRADRDRVPTYLLTNSEANVRLYAKMGFEVAGSTRADDDAIGASTWRMIRPAR